jgi:hypothetical protein
MHIHNLLEIKAKKRVNCTLEQAMQAHRGNTDTSPPFVGNKVIQIMHHFMTIITRSLQIYFTDFIKIYTVTERKQQTCNINLVSNTNYFTRVSNYKITVYLT